MNDVEEHEDAKQDTVINEEPIEEQSAQENNEWLDNPKRIRFIICACIVFVIMTLVIILQLFYSDSYRSWKSYDKTKQNTDFIVSPMDINRTFDIITLDNGLEIFIISDSSTDKSAAAIDVHIGSSSDPLSYLGLAHFHEHMLFLGSTTYPSLDSFSSYISMNGGSDNAFTENEHTNFFFSVDNKHFSHALDIFSHFFIDPLLTKSSMNHEIQAVDNEYKKDLPSQSWRDWRMLEYSSNTNHPFHKFSVGSLKTLEKDNAYAAMTAFHNKYVKANIMKCVIYGRDDVTTLAKWAKDKFSTIASNKTLKIKDNDDLIPYRIHHETFKIYYIETVTKQKQITYFWGISGLNLEKHYRTPVLSFINAHLLESATNNSLFDILKIKLLFIISMDCDVFYSSSSWSGTKISFELTEKGTKHIDIITMYLYKYLDLLLSKAKSAKTIKKNIFWQYFHESKCIDSLYFNYYSLIQKDAYSTVSGLAKRMQYRQRKDLLYLSLNVIPDRLIFNLSLIIDVLSFLCHRDNVVIHYTNNDFDSAIFDEMEPFFNIKFHRQRINSDFMFKNDLNLKHSLLIPPLNPYILNGNNECAHDSGLIKRNKNNNKNKITLITSSSSMRIWYKSSPLFLSPRININVLLISPLLYDTAINAIYCEIWLQFIDFYSSEWYSFVSSSGFSLDVSLNHQGIVLSITGLNSVHLTDLISSFISRYLCSISSLIVSNMNTSQHILSNILSSLHKTYKNMNYGHIWDQAYATMYDIVKNPHFSAHLMFDIVSGLIATTNKHSMLLDIAHYINDVLSNGFLIEALFHGNIYKKHVFNLVSSIAQSGVNIRDNVNEAVFEGSLIKMDHLKLRINISSHIYSSFAYFGCNRNPSDSNDLTQIWYQFGENARINSNYIETVKVLLLARMMKSSCFKVLRTEESLGYVATAFSKSSVGATNNVNYLIIMVASAHKSAVKLNERILHFVNHYYANQLMGMSQKKFKLFINSTINALKQKYLRLSQETSLIWDEIIGHTYFFKWKTKYIDILKQLTLQEMRTFYKEYILGKHAKRISIQLFHEKNKEKYHQIVTNDKNTDDHDTLYFNKTKDLQNLGYAQYFNVY